MKVFLSVETVDLQRVVMEQSGSEVHLTWFGTENEALTAVDIAWCKMRPAGFKCKVRTQYMHYYSAIMYKGN